MQADTMSFLIRLSFGSFIEDIPAGSTVYVAAFTQGTADKARAFVLLTTDVSGVIHAVRLRFELGGSDAGEIAIDASGKLKTILGLKGIAWSTGVLLTVGLEDALPSYSNTDLVSIEQLDNFIAKAKSKGNVK